MATTKITTNRGVCYVLSQKSFAHKKAPREWYCPLCQDQIVVGRPVYLLISNGKLFPNIIVHQDCAPKICDKTIDTIHNDYIEYLRKKKELAEDYVQWR